ncbi:MAG: LysM peptidoglycan-binding domain-containing protein [Tissierellia bacterium]|nr:LysM peptidoglycan-binding domain-containing protein [Tissierellia bacterium]
MIILNKYRVTDIRKFKRFMFILILLISLLSFSLISTFNAYSKDITQYDYISVQEGDTLWAIASEYSNKDDIRKVIYIISKVNNISEATIYPGDIIKIPLNLVNY